MMVVTMMVVTETWILIEHIHDANLVSALTEHRRRFIKALRYILPAARPLAGRSSPTPSPPPSRSTSSRRQQNRRACAHSNPSSPRVSSPLGGKITSNYRYL